MYPTLVGLVSRWARPLERSRALAWGSSSITVGSACGTALTGFLMEAYGWRSVFLLFGVAGLLWLPMWHRFGWSSPLEHPRITAEEMNSITKAQSTWAAAEEDYQELYPSKVPWLFLLSQRGVLVVFFTTMLNGFSMGILTTFMPTYLHQQHGIRIEDVGLLSSCPMLLQVLVQVVASSVADRMLAAGTSATHVRKVFQCLACSGSGLCSLLLCESPSARVAVFLLCFGPAIGGLSVCGVSVAPVDMCPKFASIIIGVDNAIWALTTGMTSTFEGFLLDWGRCPTQDKTSVDPADLVSCRHSWELAFGLAGCSWILGGCIYALLGSAEPLELPGGSDGRKVEQGDRGETASGGRIDDPKSSLLGEASPHEQPLGACDA